MQDLAVDDLNNQICLADIASPGMIALDMAAGTARDFSNHPSLQTEPNAKTVKGGKEVCFQGRPALVALNLITLSADKETICYGAMNHRTWYALSANLFRQHASGQKIAQAIRKIGPRPCRRG